MGVKLSALINVPTTKKKDNNVVPYQIECDIHSHLVMATNAIAQRVYIVWPKTIITPLNVAIRSLGSGEYRNGMQRYAISIFRMPIIHIKLAISAFSQNLLSVKRQLHFNFER